MADENVRKSSRIKTRKKTNYLEDDFEYDFDLNWDITDNISSTVEPQKSQKDKDKSVRNKKSSSGTLKKTAKTKKTRVSNSKTEDSETKATTGLVKNDPATVQDGYLDSSEVVCQICNLSLSSKEELEKHLSKHQSEHRGGYKCDICDRICVDEGAYNRHMKSHSANRKHKCEFCDKAFSESCSLKRHMKTHEDDRPYTCDLCFKSFRDHPSLIRHQKTHTDRPRMYQCAKCDKSFSEKHGLKRHERTHTGIRPFECQICFKTFSESGSFKRHQKIHTGIRNFFCGVCNKSFLEKQSLIRHQKNVCGFGNDPPPSNSSLNSSVDIDQSMDSLYYSTADNSETHHSNYADDTSGSYSQAVNDTDHKQFKLSLSTTEIPNALSSPSSFNRNHSINKNAESNRNHKEAPSLHSLIKKDPNLYDSISEFVESIDSYEQMLDLCGDRGQKKLDAVLTREPVPMPDNLLCFECGELLVDGENFRGEGRTFHPTLTNSYKCLGCEADDKDYGEPPVLTAEIPISRTSTHEETDMSQSDADLVQATENNMEKMSPDVTSDGSNSRNIFGTNETLEHFKERLKSQHGVCFIDDVYSSAGYDVGMGGYIKTEQSSSQASALYSGSTDIKMGPIVQSTVNEQTSDLFIPFDGQNWTQDDDNKAAVHLPVQRSEDSTADWSTNNHTKHQTSEAGNLEEPNVKPEYEADDPSIPSVFPCHLCTKVFATSAFLDRHLELHKMSPYRCMVCSKTFTNSPNLKRHMTTHTGEKPYSCPYCDRNFRDPSNFSKHKKLCASTWMTLSPLASPASSASSPPTPDNSNLLSNSADPNSHMADLKPKLNLVISPGAGKISSSLESPSDFGLDDVDEALPLTFGHVSPGQVHVSPEDKKQTKQTRSTRTRGNPSSAMQVHMEPEIVPLPIPCPTCGKVCSSEENLALHMKYHSGDPDVTCIECGKSFADAFGLKRHIRIHAGVRPHVCEYCQRGYCDNWSLKKHRSRGCVVSELRVPADFLHPCLQCNRVFADIESLQEHMVTHKGVPKFECDICQKRFSEAFNLKRHRRLHMAVCSGCEREFKDIQSLTEHQVSECSANRSEFPPATRIDGFPCPECGRVYSSKAYLERHKKFHSGLKPYSCEICSKKFSEAFRLRRHMKVHLGNRPFRCKSCGKTFTDGTSLRRHIAHTKCLPLKEQIHQPTGQIYSCTLCDKVFGKNYLLVRHMNVHSQERPFACNICNRSYKDTSSLKRHQLVHQGVKEFICPLCGKDFFYSDSLKRHIAGSCGKPKPPKRKRVRRKRSKSNNNIKMANNNTMSKTPLKSEPPKENISEEQTSLPKGNQAIPKKRFTIQIPARKVQISHWSCHRKKQCWRCNLRFPSTSSLCSHARIHQHKKPYYCPICFMRWARKSYWKVHPHKSVAKPLKLTISKVKKEVAPAEMLERPRRSIPRARWSWISQI